MPADPTLAAIIRAVESSNNYSALRFEPGMYALANPGMAGLSLCMQKNACNDETAKVLLSMSFGAYQIMGFNLWGGLNCEQSAASFLNDAIAQDNVFSAFLDKNDIAYSWAEMKVNPACLNHFAVNYNGSGSYALTLINTATRMGL
jgi:hypothetical protein